MRRPSMLQTRSTSSDSSRRLLQNNKNNNKASSNTVVANNHSKKQSRRASLTPRAVQQEIHAQLGLPRRRWLPGLSNLLWIATLLVLWTRLSIQQVVHDKRLLVLLEQVVQSVDDHDTTKSRRGTTAGSINLLTYPSFLLAFSKLLVASVGYVMVWTLRLRTPPRSLITVTTYTLLLSMIALFNVLGLWCLGTSLQLGTATLTHMAKSSQPAVSICIGGLVGLGMGRSKRRSKNRFKTTWIRQFLLVFTMVAGTAYACLEQTAPTTLHTPTMCILAALLSTLCFSLRSVLSRQHALRQQYHRHGAGIVFGVITIWSLVWMCVLGVCRISGLLISTMMHEGDDAMFSTRSVLVSSRMAADALREDYNLVHKGRHDLLYSGMYYYASIEVAFWLVRAVDSATWHTISDSIRRAVVLVVTSDILNEQCCTPKAFAGYVVAEVGNLVYAYYTRNVLSQSPRKAVIGRPESIFRHTYASPPKG